MLAELGTCTCVCSRGSHAHCLAITSVVLMVVACRTRDPVLSRATLALSITSLGYHATHRPHAWSAWRCADVVMCHVFGTIVFVRVLRRSTWYAHDYAGFATLALSFCAALHNKSGDKPYTLFQHTAIHLLTSLGIELLGNEAK